MGIDLRYAAAITTLFFLAVNLRLNAQNGGPRMENWLLVHDVDTPSIQAISNERPASTVVPDLTTQMNVLSFGAKGDCMTDDHDSIMAAQASALRFTPPAALYFPKPSGSCYLTSTIQWAGVSLLGQPAGQGFSAGDGPEQFGVTLKSKPGQDILHGQDPTTETFVWNRSWSIRDISFMTDGSQSSSFPHRWPGRWFDDTHTTSGSSIITSHDGEFSCGDVGQAIQINGAGDNGSNLVTTIQSVSPCWAGAGNAWQVIAIATKASRSVTNAHTYVSVLGLSVTARIGNCGIAFDDNDGNPTNWANPKQKIGNAGSEMIDVSFLSTGTSSNTCGFYTQGVWGPYQFTARNVNFTWGTYGVVEGTAELNSKHQSSGNDFEIWDHNWFYQEKYPWITYNGGSNVLENTQLATQSGPQILQVGNLAYDATSNWRINIPQFELVNTSTGYGLRIEGNNHVLIDTSLNGPQMTSYINTSQLTCIACTSWGKNLVVGGSGNTFQFTGALDSLTVSDVGRGNRFLGSYSANPFRAMPNAYPQTMFPYKGESQVVGRVTADALLDGYSDLEYNHDDLLFWPQDFMINPGTSYSTYYKSDSSSPSGANWTFTPDFMVSNFSQFAYPTTQNRLVLGTNFPQARAKVSYSAKCPAGVNSLLFSIVAGAAVVASDTQRCTTTYQTYSFGADFSSYPPGTSLGFKNTGSTDLIISWAAIIPNSGSMPLSGITPEIGGSALAAGECVSATVSIAGATSSMVVAASPSANRSPGSGYVWQGYVSSPGMVTVEVCALLGGRPTSTKYNIRVIR